MGLILWILAGVAALFAAAVYICYWITFRRHVRKAKPIVRVDGPHANTMREGGIFYDSLPFEELQIRSFDGLTLHGRYAPAGDGRHVILMFHGYRSSARNDFGCVLKFYMEQGWGVLLVDQRAHGRSEGKTISFGINERRDCQLWAEYAVRRFGKDCRLVLDGISMGAATVMMAAELPLPGQVKGVIADSGYSSPREIIRKVAAGMGIPAGLAYFFIRIGARCFGGFDPDEASAEAAMRACKLPVLMVHGEADVFVPCEMSRRCHAACAGERQLYTVPGATHGFSYLVDREGCETRLKAFLEDMWNR